MTLTQAPTDVDIASPAFKADPFPFYAHLRAEQPVFRTTMRNKEPVTLVTRYDDVLALLKDERFMKDRNGAQSEDQRKKAGWMPGFARAFNRNMLFLDAPDHTRLRNLVHKAFTPKLIEQMRDRAQNIADELLDAAERKGQFDLVNDYALPLPVVIISDMIGVEEQDRHKFAGWSKRMVGVGVSSPKDGLALLPTIWAFANYIRKLIRTRKQNPQDDLLTALIDASESGDTLTEDELMGMLLLLLVAGHETTANLIANGTLELLQHPDQLALLRDNPDLSRSAVEELLRYTGPVERGTERYASADIELQGVTIPQGELVLAVLASANRDETQFPNADTLDITRDPNRHLAFGMGIHYCLGAPLARLEGQIAFNTLLRRMPNLHLTAPAETLRWRRSMILRGLEELPVSI